MKHKNYWCPTSFFMTILQSELKNSKWRIQYSGHFWLNSTFFVQISQRWMYDNGVFEVAGDNFDVKNEKIKMADPIWRPFLTKFEVFFKMYKNKYNGVFEVTDYGFEVENEEFKMAVQYGGHFGLNSAFFI